MKNWKSFFQNYRLIDIKNDEDLLYQVGFTVKSKPISKNQFQIIIESINKELQMNEDDVLLDLCCGNGIITYSFSHLVKEIVGIDVSKPYIENANRFKKANNVTYLLGDVTDSINLSYLIKKKDFNKIILYGSLAYFAPKDLETVLRCLKASQSPSLSFMIGGILDKNKKGSFYNNFSRKINYILNHKLLGKDMGLGRWWTKNEISKIATKNDYYCRFIDQDPSLYSSHYRFDCVLIKKTSITD
jgi:cyclopropane fatty-acyl-phospholipid synthase-like methyltransferase